MPLLNVSHYRVFLLGWAGLLVASRVLAAPPPLTVPQLAEWIDARCEAAWPQPADHVPTLVDDPTFLRRLSLDLLGVIPSVAQTRDFLADPSAEKRSRSIGRILALNSSASQLTERSAEHLARVWRRVLVPGNGPDAARAVRLDPWLKTQFASNVHYDELARALLSAKPAPPSPQATTSNARLVAAEGPLVFYEAVGATPENLANSFTRTFLGVRLGCAQCHDHPFAEWKQHDFWGMAAFFAGSGRGPNGEWRDEPVSTITDTATSKSYPARFLWSDAAHLPEQQSPREAFAAWMTSPANPNFAATAVNRVWQYLCGRGLIHAVDDLDLSSADERQLLDELGEHFEAAGYDLRWLIAGICHSKTYQRACFVNHIPGSDPPIGARPVKTLLPEQVFDSLEQALALPVSKVDDSARHNGQMGELLTRLNEAIATSPEDFRGGVPQALLLMNGQLIATAVDLKESRTLRGVVEAPFLNDDDKLNTLYLATLTRFPRETERTYLLDLVHAQTDRTAQKQTWGEIFWALLNSPEFVLSR